MLSCSNHSSFGYWEQLQICLLCPLYNASIILWVLIYFLIPQFLGTAHVLPVCNSHGIKLFFSKKADSFLEKAMALHSSTLAWKIPWMEEPGRLQSMGSLRVIHDCVTSLPLFTFMHWRRKWQPTPVFLPGESQGWGSLVGYRLWGCTESDMTEVT